MKDRRSPLQRAVIMICVFVFIVFGIEAHGLKKALLDAPPPRAGAIVIDTLADFGDLEFPAVVFLHETHTKALAKVSKDCRTCHLQEKDRRSLKFKRFTDTNRQELMDTYHDGCIGCHQEMAGQVEKTGPSECRVCHAGQGVIPARLPMEFDKSLHFRHSQAQDDKCEACHHEYDEKAQKLIYVKGQEGTCRYCHLDQTEENRISMRLASHLSCLDCHEKTAAAGKDSGPIECSGCHGQVLRGKIKKVDTPPRMKRNQPDIVLVKTGPGTTEFKNPPLKMNPVPFDHKAHESNNESCRICHHADLKSCSDCHTLTGSKDGNLIRLEQAMHRPGADASCLGCHKKKQREKNCAGCHASSMDKQPEDSSCIQCHMTPPQDKEPCLAHSPEEKQACEAERLLKSRPLVTGTFPDDDIPEKVIIKTIEDKYEPVDFPHRRVINALVEGLKGNRLAEFFHADKGAVCQGCHHNSPPGKKPPQCGSCHGKPFAKEEPLRPGMKGAYHLQCMGCHAEMGIEKPAATACVQCHKEKIR